ncbi:DHA2 family efflux MFS transporter permease subunit [Streptomyces sp. B1866]|uniref:DHA2 family efflux MFS transporter permease subunit n=1 Tax=Streptomyces sp. B1866 TaxID=3075431 RepID=UPI00288F963D|nr:DHA2 family efflux MFS transporter permease subunit [Streptomyces sp. B1866]MDT3398564.1 DHA2 family efflux MFS transporter permease subunit [Streptomyces sp. B1866]
MTSRPTAGTTSGPPPGPGEGADVVLSYADARGRWVLLATVLGSAMASIDATVVGIALPAIGRDYGTGLTTLQWVVTAYTLTLAGLLLVAGALGDRYGRRRLFVVGTVWFALASVLCGVAPNAPVLVAARALQGVGAALLAPGSLAILEASFRPEDRGRAIGAWSGLSGVATAVGPFLGGLLVQAASWRLIFAINLPVAVAVVVVARRYVPESRDPAATGPVDTVGATLIATGLAGLSYGLIEGPARGWDSPAVLVTLVGGALLTGAFVAWERRTAAPMLPLGLFSSAAFTATNVVTFILYGALSGVMFLLPLQLQQVSGYTALEAGVSLLPATALMLVLSARSGSLATRIGPRPQMSLGPVLVGLGMLLFLRVGRTGDYVTEVLPAVVVFGFGLAATVAPLTATVLAAAPARHAGMASAVNNDVARAAGLVAVAVLPAAAGITSAAYADPARFSAGFHTASLICAGLCVAAGALSAVALRGPRPAPAGPPARHRLHCPLDAPPAQGREP